MCCRKDRESRLHKVVQVHQHFSGTLASGAMPYYPFCQTSSGHGLVGTRYQCTNSAVEVDYGNGSAGLEFQGLGSSAAKLDQNRRGSPDAVVISSYSSTLVFTDRIQILWPLVISCWMLWNILLPPLCLAAQLSEVQRFYSDNKLNFVCRMLWMWQPQLGLLSQKNLRPEPEQLPSHLIDDWK